MVVVHYLMMMMMMMNCISERWDLVLVMLVVVYCALFLALLVFLFEVLVMLFVVGCKTIEGLKSVIFTVFGGVCCGD